MWRDFCCHQRGEATAATKSSHASPFPGQVLALYAPLSWRRASVAQLRPCCCSGRNQSSALCFAQRAKKRAALGSHPAGPSLLLHRQRWQLSGCCFTPPPVACRPLTLAVPDFLLWTQHPFPLKSVGAAIDINKIWIMPLDNATGKKKRK